MIVTCMFSETTLDHRVMQVRQAIGDSGQAQRRMQTLRGRGYRFVGAVEERTAASASLLAPVLPQGSATVGAPAVLVGRTAELAQLHQWYTAAGQGQRQVVFVTGEVGIGKTTLVDAFVTAIRGHDDIWVGRGQCSEHHGSGEAYRLQGELLLRHAIPDTAQAEACFQKALAIARHQQARSWELRVAMSLARLWQQQGKGAAAYQVLAEVYSWFTEGFETADLQEAKALLAILARSAGYDLTC